VCDWVQIVKGWIHFGMASIGVKPPESAISGGLTKNSMSCPWVAERALVATKVPMPP